MRLRRLLSGGGPTGRAALAGLLALLLLVAATFSVSHALHQGLHHDGATDGHLCLLCALAKGQVSAAVVAVVPAALVLPCFWISRTLSSAPLPAFDHRTSRSRAPPYR